MNPQLIEKVIKSNKETICPEFTYSNPLLDQNVTKALSKSFVKILASEQNTNVNNNLRLSILENIRKICRIEPENHIKFNEDHTELLTDFYRKHIHDTSINSSNDIEKELNAFLIRNFKELTINSSHNSHVNPEVVQALINLNCEAKASSLTDNLIHWNANDIQSKTLLNNLWNQSSGNSKINDIVIKNKPEIEELLLTTSLKLLEGTNDGTELSNQQYERLFKTCAIAPYCFQICIDILNLLFVSTNFDVKIHDFIKLFISKVKMNCSEYAISYLYPTHLNHVVVLLDVDFNELPSPIKEEYVATAVKYLNDVRTQSESDFILLLSHFPQWFNESI
ncbi:unnamed protein product [Colias eurytheme]|nr:unnamed protein product [Colias eurytheme]